MGAFATSYGSVGFIYGGRSSPEGESSGTYYQDMYSVSLSSAGNKLTTVTQNIQPGAKSEGGMTVMKFDTTMRVYMYGGRGAAGAVNNLNWFVFNPTNTAISSITWSTSNYANAPKLWGLGFACIGKNLYLYGGQLDSGAPNTQLRTVRTE